VPGVTGKLVVNALSDRGRLSGWMPLLEDAVEYLAGRTQAGDVLLTIGAGDVDRAPALLRERLGRTIGAR
jgi:UDP-N-acetylmuramate-alanine ligase